MAKGSQLSQLKSALNQAGLTQKPSNGKKRKRSVLEDKEKDKKAAQLKEIQRKMNPFDTKVTKLKHDVGGRKIAGMVGRPAQSKQAGIEQRKKTLLKEYDERDRVGGIVDRRFGENDPTMTPEERMLERFTRERQRASKGSAFNLDDDEELTHYGQSLSKLDDFDNVGLGLDDEDEDNGQLDRATVQKNHFGGFSDDEDSGDEDEPERKKSKAEVMAEVIAKSKEHKFMRQNQQEEDENMRHALDEEFADIRSLLFAPAEKTGETQADPIDVDMTEDKDQEYDQFVRELVFEKRAKPKDRTKTEEELALEEKEALEKAERRRIRRMNGEDDESEDEEEGEKKKKRPRGGDDLEDDFVDDEDHVGLGAGLGEEALDLKGEDDDDGPDEEESGEEGSEDDEEAESSDEYDFGGSEDDESEGEEGDAEDLVQSKPSSSKRKSVPTSSELPYTFPCPSSHDEFLEIIEDIKEDDIPTVVKRIRTLHHPSLAEDNKFKLQVLTGVLIDHILHVTSPPSPQLTLLSSLLPHIYALTKSYPIQSAEHFISKLNLMQKNLKRGLAHGVTEPDAKTWPGLPELSLLRIISMVWPTSDMNHPVISPARLLMGSYLGLCRVRSLRDLGSGLFLCTVFLQFEQLSKRFIPEAVSFLVNTVLHLLPHSFKNASALPGSFAAPDFKSELCKSLAINLRKTKKLTPQKPDLTQLLADDSTVDEQPKLDLLNLAFELIGQYAGLYKSLEGFPELFDPVLTVLKSISPVDLSGGIKTKLTGLTDTLTRLLKFSTQSRLPLRLQAHKPIPIQTFIPKFEHTSSNYLNKNRDPDHERHEAAKLRAQYKQERKGALRELRKDGKFLAAEQQKRQKEKDQSYNARMKRVFGEIEGERAEQKKLEREKARDKKRAGRK